GMPLQAGLYTMLAALVAYAIFGTSRQLVVVATSASAVMLASVITTLNPPDQVTYIALAGGLVLVVGALFILAGILKLGFITNFISRPVMEGFIFGLAVYVSVKQLPKLFGISSGDGNSLQQIWYVLGHLGQTNMATLVVGAGALALLFVFHRFARQVPAGLVVLVAGIILSATLGLSAVGVKVVGVIPAGLPAIGLPEVRLSDLWVLLPSALGMFLVIFSEGLGAANVFASKHNYEVKPDQELIAYGAANISSGLLGGLAAGGSLSQSSVNDSAGARTSVSLLVAALMGFITIIALTPLFTDLPEAVLAALIIFAVMHLMKVRQMQNFYRLQKAEFWMGMLALLGVLILDVLPGLAIAVLFSLIYVIYKSSRPHVSVLGSVPGSPGAYTDILRHPEDRPVEGLIIFRLNAPLYFANAPLIYSRLRELVRNSQPPPTSVILDMSACDSLDITSLETLEKLVTELKEANIEVMAAEVHQPVRDMMLRSGMAGELNRSQLFPTVDAAVKDFIGRHAGQGSK
ncbi:MAG: SulP family inorganic anion transporter, partial [Chloroflexi bacterium]|nr:SulP family inorganic anion transporter [Chloroflexota bacterium]